MTAAATITEANRAEGLVAVSHAGGLHARPSVILTQVAKGFACAVELATAPEGPWVNAKSIVRVMGLKVPTGGLIRIRAAGPNAIEAVGAIEALVARDFSPDASAMDDADALPL